MGGRCGDMCQGRAGAGGKADEVVGDLGDEGVVLEVACGGEDHVAGGEASGVVIEDDLLVETGDGLDGPQDGTAEGVAFPKVLGEGLVDEVVGIVLVHF